MVLILRYGLEVLSPRGLHVVLVGHSLRDSLAHPYLLVLLPPLVFLLHLAPQSYPSLLSLPGVLVGPGILALPEYPDYQTLLVVPAVQQAPLSLVRL